MQRSIRIGYIGYITVKTNSAENILLWKVLRIRHQLLGCYSLELIFGMLSSTESRNILYFCSFIIHLVFANIFEKLTFFPPDTRTYVCVSLIHNYFLWETMHLSSEIRNCLNQLRSVGILFRNLPVKQWFFKHLFLICI